MPETRLQRTREAYQEQAIDGVITFGRALTRDEVVRISRLWNDATVGTCHPQDSHIVKAVLAKLGGSYTPILKARR